MAEIMDSKKLEPGMDDAQAQADRRGWAIPVTMPTGQNEIAAVGANAGPEVGNQYDVDPMGEEYSAVTYDGKSSGGVDSAPTEKK